MGWGAYQKHQVRAWGPEGKSEPATKFSKLGKIGVSTGGVFLCSSGLLAQEPGTFSMVMVLPLGLNQSEAVNGALIKSMASKANGRAVGQLFYSTFSVFSLDLQQYELYSNASLVSLVVSGLLVPQGLGLNAGTIPGQRTQMSFAACFSSSPVVLACLLCLTLSLAFLSHRLSWQGTIPQSAPRWVQLPKLHKEDLGAKHLSHPSLLDRRH